MPADLTTALLNVLMYFQCQEARELASRMITDKRAPRDKLLRVLALIDREGWGHIGSTKVLREHARREKPVARRVTR